MTLCEQALSAILMGAGVLFWAWYLIDEASRAKGLRKRRWYDAEIGRKGDTYES